ncbi:hypothetical protein Ndes2526B_g01604 [Nannochloris sp. 'desiccata']
MLRLEKVSRLAGRRFSTPVVERNRWMSMDAQTSRNASQGFQQGPQSGVGEGQTPFGGTATVSNQQLLEAMHTSLG